MHVMISHQPPTKKDCGPFKKTTKNYRTNTGYRSPELLVTKRGQFPL